MTLDAAPTDAHLIERTRAGDQAAFEALVHRYEPLVLGYTRHLLEHDLEAEDVAQETFLKAFRELASLREIERFLPWLKAIAWRECRAWVRAKQSARAALQAARETRAHTPDLPTDPLLDDGEPDPWLARLERTMENMGEGRRAVLSLFYLDELPQEKIAAFLEIPVGTVKRRLFEGRRDVSAAAAPEPPADLPGRKRFVSAVKRLLAQPKQTLQTPPLSVRDRKASPSTQANKEHPMKIAVLSCIHGNLPALEAVVKELDAAKPDQVYCLGDVINYGTEPSACIGIVRERGWTVLQGNHEAFVLEPAMLDEFNPFARNCGFFTLGALSASDRAWIKTLPLTASAAGIQFVHGSPVKGKEVRQYLLSQEDMKAGFEAMTAPLCFVGHTHVPMAMYDEATPKVSKDAVQQIDPKVKTIVNVGAVGQPRDRDPRACWVLYDSATKTLEYRRTSYDTQEACRRIKDAGLPAKMGERLLTAV
ncbi:MAG: sigma-70 family RNA polymerase sigma factor [Planctomycetota bacterium]|nr:sigma-70 family RNA polymerase sigma factor [Planctomycetota bacterium]